MNDINSVILIGRLVRDPELKIISGKELCNISIANNRSFGDKSEVSYFDCEAWGKLAGVINKYCHKGSRIVVSGRLRQNRWEQEGQKRSKVSITVETIQFLDGREESGAPAPEEHNNPFE